MNALCLLFPLTMGMNLREFKDLCSSSGCVTAYLLSHERQANQRAGTRAPLHNNIIVCLRFLPDGMKYASSLKGARGAAERGRARAPRLSLTTSDSGQKPDSTPSSHLSPPSYLNNNLRNLKNRNYGNEG